MSAHDDGGPAFPIASDLIGHNSGATLRDLFAALAPSQPENWRAPTSMLISASAPSGLGPEYQAAWDAYRAAAAHNTLAHEASWRWAYADAMLAARKGGAE